MDCPLNVFVEFTLLDTQLLEGNISIILSCLFEDVDHILFELVLLLLHLGIVSSLMIDLVIDRLEWFRGAGHVIMQTFY